MIGDASRQDTATVECYACGLDTPEGEIRRVVFGMADDPHRGHGMLVRPMCPTCAERYYRTTARGEYE